MFFPEPPSSFSAENVASINNVITKNNYRFYFEDDVHPGKSPYHEAGLYYLQEPSAMLVAELMAVCKDKGTTVFEYMENIYNKYGIFEQNTVSQRFEGIENRVLDYTNDKYIETYNDLYDMIEQATDNAWSDFEDEIDNS